MSNLIKSPYVNLKGKKAVVIDNNSDRDRFSPLGSGSVKIQTIGEREAGKALLQAAGIAGERAEEAQEGERDDSAGAGFQEGIKVTNFDALFHEHQKKVENKAEKAILAANEEAQKIKQEAQIAAEAARNRGYEEGKAQGYQEGLALAEQEIQSKEAELAAERGRQQEELSDCIASVEEKYVDIVISLVKKLTGIVIEEREGLILYLIRMAAADLDPSANYRIRVSSEDIYFLESRREEIADSLGEDVVLEFAEEKGLEKNQCIIETDSQMVDCGLQTQLDTLVRDLKMLVR